MEKGELVDLLSYRTLYSMEFLLSFTVLFELIWLESMHVECFDNVTIDSCHLMISGSTCGFNWRLYLVSSCRNFSIMPPKRAGTVDNRRQASRARNSGSSTSRRGARSPSPSLSPSPPPGPEFDRTRFVSAYVAELFAIRKDKPFIYERALLPTACMNRAIYNTLTLYGWRDFCER